MEELPAASEAKVELRSSNLVLRRPLIVGLRTPRLSHLTPLLLPRDLVLHFVLHDNDERGSRGDEPVVPRGVRRYYLSLSVPDGLDGGKETPVAVHHLAPGSFAPELHVQLVAS